MQKFIVTPNEAGQRLDKLLVKYLNLAPKSFIYKHDYYINEGCYR